MNPEIIGIIGSIFVLLAMLVQSSSIKGNIAMRIINIIGSDILVIKAYGLKPPVLQVDTDRYKSFG